MMVYKTIFMIAGMVSLTYSKPIMVSFGTKQGPIVPATPISSTVNPLAPKSAAPVFEQEENAPEAPRYRPPTPHQYRKQIYSFRPNPNLILGTPLDIKYTPALEKYDILSRKSKIAQSEGLGYTGPQAFDVQEYEIERAAKKSGSSAKYFVDQYRAQKRSDQSQTYQKQGPLNYDYQQQSYQNQNQQQPQNNQQQQSYQNQNQQQPQNYQPQSFQSQNQQQTQDNQQLQTYQTQNYQQAKTYQYNNQRNVGFVPEIGIVYSSGVRYYIPQLHNEGENSVYDGNDVKYFYRQQY